MKLAYILLSCLTLLCFVVVASNRKEIISYMSKNFGGGHYVEIKSGGGQPCNVSGDAFTHSVNDPMVYTSPIDQYTTAVSSVVPGVRQVTKAQTGTAAYIAAQNNNPYQEPTPQAKMISVNDLLGNPGIAFQQGTSRVLYDGLPTDARTTFNFFRDVNTHVFPQTNLTENRLGVAEAMVIENIYFVVQTTAAAPPSVTLNAPLSVALPGFYSSVFDLSIAQQQTIKPFPLFSMQSQFNDQAKFLNNDVLRLRTLQVIPPLIEFAVNLRTPTYVLIALTFLICALEGAGCLISPKQNF